MAERSLVHDQAEAGVTEVSEWVCLTCFVSVSIIPSTGSP